jgi:hypothetical protein
MNLKLYFIYAILLIVIEKLNIRSAPFTKHKAPLRGKLGETL